MMVTPLHSLFLSVSACNMGILRTILVLGLVQCAFTDSLIKRRCQTADEFSECLPKTLQEFFRDSSSGVPVHEIKSTDPIVIPSVVVKEDDIGFESEFKNAKVTGFSQVTVTDLNSNMNDQNTNILMKFNLVSEGDIKISLKSGKSFSGTFKYEGDVKGDTKYTYTVKEVNNIQYFEISPETLKCDANNVKTFLNPELREALLKDNEAHKMAEGFEKIAEAHYEKLVCEMATVVMKTAVENLRTYVRAGV